MHLPSDRKCPGKVPLCRKAWLLLVIGVFLSGCSSANDGRLAVTGEVSFDGQPIGDGYITLSPLAKGPSAGGRIVDGKFQIPTKGPTEGEYRVIVQAMRRTGRMIPVDPAVPEDKVEESVQFLPPQFNTRTQFSATLSPDNTHLVFDLKSKP